MREYVGSGGPGETRVLQVILVILCFIPIGTGIAGIVLGPSFLGVQTPWPKDLDSHFRFLSGVFLALGLGFLSTVPDIGRKTLPFRAFAAMIFAGGLARLLSLGVSGVPSAGHVGGLVIELVVVPLLVLWQVRIAARSVNPP